MTYPIIRIFLRYVVAGVLGWFIGAEAGSEVGEILAADPDIVEAIAVASSLVVAGVVEWWWTKARNEGGAT
jgi:hypothetical protein